RTSPCPLDPGRLLRHVGDLHGGSADEPALGHARLRPLPRGAASQPGPGRGPTANLEAASRRGADRVQEDTLALAEESLEPPLERAPTTLRAVPAQSADLPRLLPEGGVPGFVCL